MTNDFECKCQKKLLGYYVQNLALCNNSNFIFFLLARASVKYYRFVT